MPVNSYEIDPVELSPDLYQDDFEFQMSMLETPQVFQTELPQGQLFQDNVTPPPQPQSHTEQQPLPAGESPSGFPGLSEYDNAPLPPQLQSPTEQQPFTTGEDISGFFGPSEHDMSWNQQPDNVPPSPPLQLQSHTEQQPFTAGEDPSGFLGPSEYMSWDQQPDNVPSPPQPQSYAGQHPFPVGEHSSGVLDPSEINMPTYQPVPPPYPPEVEAPGPDQVAEPDPPADIRQHMCPVCGRPFDRTQERNRHVRSSLPHCIYCPFPNCPFRCDRPDNLVNHWTKKHVDSGQVEAPLSQQQAREYQIYDPNPLVTRVVIDHIPMEVAIYDALSVVEERAQVLGKEGAWAGNLWGRRQRPHVWLQ